jgi:hypothetical protein
MFDSLEVVYIPLQHSLEEDVHERRNVSGGELKTFVEEEKISRKGEF